MFSQKSIFVSLLSVSFCYILIVLEWSVWRSSGLSFLYLFLFIAFVFASYARSATLIWFFSLISMNSSFLSIFTESQFSSCSYFAVFVEMKFSIHVIRASYAIWYCGFSSCVNGIFYSCYTRLLCYWYSGISSSLVLILLSLPSRLLRGFLLLGISAFLIQHPGLCVRYFLSLFPFYL